MNYFICRAISKEKNIQFSAHFSGSQTGVLCGLSALPLFQRKIRDSHGVGYTLRIVRLSSCPQQSIPVTNIQTSAPCLSSENTISFHFPNNFTSSSIHAILSALPSCWESCGFFTPGDTPILVPFSAHRQCAELFMKTKTLGIPLTWTKYSILRALIKIVCTWIHSACMPEKKDFHMWLSAGIRRLLMSPNAENADLCKKWRRWELNGNSNHGKTPHIDISFNPQRLQKTGRQPYDKRKSGGTSQRYFE